MLLGKPLLLKYNIQFPQLRPVKVHYKKLENAHDDDEDDNILRADGIDTHGEEDDDDDHHAGGDDHGHGSDGKVCVCIISTWLLSFFDLCTVCSLCLLFTPLHG
jgi:hypothetical protein